MLSKSKTTGSLILFLALTHTGVQANNDATGLALEGGWSEDGSDVGRGGIAFQSNLFMPSYTLRSWQLRAYWEISASYWSSKLGSTQTDELAEFGLTPFIRLQPVEPLYHGIKPFLEGGIGLHAITEDRINNSRFGSEFTFGNHAGVGLRYGDFDISYRFQHLSNAGLGEPNTGINFHLLRLGYHF